MGGEVYTAGRGYCAVKRERDLSRKYWRCETGERDARGRLSERRSLRFRFRMSGYESSSGLIDDESVGDDFEGCI